MFDTVVTDLKLVPYKGLGIDCCKLVVDQALIIKEIETMVTEKLPLLVENDNPEINDGVVQLLELDGIDTLQALEAYVEKQLLSDMVINQVMREVLDGTRITYDDGAIEEQLEPMIENIKGQAEEQGFTLPFYCDYNGIDSIDALKELYREEIRTSYLEISVLNEIIAREEIMLENNVFQEALRRYKDNLEANQEVDEEAIYMGLAVKEAVNRLVQWNL